MAVTHDDVLLAFAGDEQARSLIGRHLAPMVHTLSRRLVRHSFHLPEGSPCRLEQARRRLRPSNLLRLVCSALCSYRPDQPEALLKALGIGLFWKLRQAPTRAADLPMEETEFLKLWLASVPEPVPAVAELLPAVGASYRAVCCAMESSFRISAIHASQVALARLLGEPKRAGPDAAHPDRSAQGEGAVDLLQSPTHLPESLLLTSIAIVHAFPSVPGFDVKTVVAAICAGLAKYDKKTGGLEQRLETEVWYALLACPGAGPVSHQEFARRWHGRDAHLPRSPLCGRGFWTWVHDLLAPHAGDLLPLITEAVAKFRSDLVEFPSDLLLAAQLDEAPARRTLAHLSIEYLHRRCAVKYPNLSPSARDSACCKATANLLQRLPSIKTLQAYPQWLFQAAKWALNDEWRNDHGRGPRGKEPPEPLYPPDMGDDAAPLSPDPMQDAHVEATWRAALRMHLRAVRDLTLQAMGPRGLPDGKEDPAPSAGAVVKAWLALTLEQTQNDLVQSFQSNPATIHVRIKEGLDRIRNALAASFECQQIIRALPGGALSEAMNRWLKGEGVDAAFADLAKMGVREKDVRKKDAKLFLREVLRFLLGWSPTTSFFLDTIETPRGQP